MTTLAPTRDTPPTDAPLSCLCGCGTDLEGTGRHWFASAECIERWQRRYGASYGQLGRPPRHVDED